MASVRKHTPTVQPAAADWPAWTDDDCWELGPDPSEVDRQWWVEQNETWDADGPTPDEVIDQQAGEAEAQSRYESGLTF